MSVNSVRVMVGLASPPLEVDAICTAVYIQGRFARRGELKTRITVTSSIFNFSTRFFAQIVENREGRLSVPILGPGDNF